MLCRILLDSRHFTLYSSSLDGSTGSFIISTLNFVPFIAFLFSVSLFARGFSDGRVRESGLSDPQVKKFRKVLTDGLCKNKDPESCVQKLIQAYEGAMVSSYQNAVGNTHPVFRSGIQSRCASGGAERNLSQLLQCYQTQAELLSKAKSLPYREPSDGVSLLQAQEQLEVAAKNFNQAYRWARSLDTALITCNYEWAPKANPLGSRVCSDYYEASTREDLTTKIGDFTGEWAPLSTTHEDTKTAIETTRKGLKLIKGAGVNPGEICLPNHAEQKKEIPSEVERQQSRKQIIEKTFPRLTGTGKGKVPNEVWEARKWLVDHPYEFLVLGQTGPDQGILNGGGILLNPFELNRRIKKINKTHFVPTTMSEESIFLNNLQSKVISAIGTGTSNPKSIRISFKLDAQKKIQKICVARVLGSSDQSRQLIRQELEKSFLQQPYPDHPSRVRVLLNSASSQAEFIQDDVDAADFCED